jgi:hypothetical protein
VYADQYVFYNRLSMSALERLPTGELVDVSINYLPFTIHGILDEINLALGLALLPHEVFNDAFFTDQYSYRLRLTEQSLAWLPGSYDFQAIVDIQQGNVRFLETGEIRIEENLDNRLMEDDIITP